MKKTKIQVIIPVYNSAETVGRCLDSLLMQTFEAWQALIIDDGSIDNSENLIRQYVNKDERFVYRRMEKNGGASRARNAALVMLTAKYVAFLDSDDTWESAMLERLYECAEKYGADVVQCGYEYVLPGGERLLPRPAFLDNVLLEGSDLKHVYWRMMTSINLNHVCMKLIRTSVIEGLTFDPKLKTAEDLEFCIRMFGRVKSYYYTKEPLYNYYRSNSSLTGRGLPFREKFASNRRVAKMLAEALPGWGMNSIFYKTVVYIRPYIMMVLKAVRMYKEKTAVWKDKGAA